MLMQLGRSLSLLLVLRIVYRGEMDKKLDEDEMVSCQNNF
jgi:hypothetical protein